MGEISTVNPVIDAGTVIELADLGEIVAFEDAIVELVSANCDHEAWAVRPDIKELLRPRINGRLFYGRMGNVSLKVMADPYERLVDARERGWTIKGANFSLSSDRRAERKTQYHGFEFIAEALSSGRGSLGIVAAEIWYYPYLRAADARNFGAAIVRQVTKPKFETTKFIEQDESARHMGLQLLRQALRHAYSGGAVDSKKGKH